MNVEERIAILEMAYTFKDKFAPVELENIPIYYTISDNEDFINWKEEAKEVLRSYGKYVPAQESIELLDYFRPMNELDDYKDLCAHIRVVIKHLKNNNRIADNAQVLDKPTVFISYNQKSGGTFVDELCKELADIAMVKRDIDCIPTWESFHEFMNTIREQDLVVLVITDEYLKSEACMYEVNELMKDHSWENKVMFAVLDGAQIYNLEGRIQYIEYWHRKHKGTESSAQELPIESISTLSDKAKLYGEIRNNIGAFLEQAADSNNPTQSYIIARIKERIERGYRCEQFN